MKHPRKSPSAYRLRSTASQALACITALAASSALVTTVRAQVIYDNFDSGALNPAAKWVNITDPAWAPPYSSYSFPADPLGGHAYRVQGIPPANNDGTGYTTARVIAVSTNAQFTNFYESVDLLNWNPSTDASTNEQFMGLIARGVTPTGDLSSGSNFNAVAMLFGANLETQHTNADNGTGGEGPSTGIIALGYVLNGYTDLPNVKSIDDLPLSAGIVPSGLAYWTLQPGRSYRLVLQGVGPVLTGSVYDLADLTKPLGTISGDTSLGGAMVLNTELAVPAPTSGYCGIFAAAYPKTSNGTNTGTVDVTFDNFYAAPTAPTSVNPPATPHGMIGAPQVVNRTPASWTNFYPAAGGITFDATTLTTTNPILTNAVRLILNGVDVSSSLTITAPSPGTNHVTFGLTGSKWTLASNCVYDAQIILPDSYNRVTTNAWTFDTFSDAYLADTSHCQNIECEDYDNNGDWRPFPVTASGFSTNDNVYYNPPPTTPPSFTPTYMYAINAAIDNVVPSGYVGLTGTQSTDATTGATTGDYYQCNRDGPVTGGPIDPQTLVNMLLGGANFDLTTIFPGCEYRTGYAGSGYGGNQSGDLVGTTEGAPNAVSIMGFNYVADTGLYLNKAFDTKRQKYAALNAVGLSQHPGLDATYTGAGLTNWWDVEEYMVFATEGSDWCNYTRDWGTTTNAYNVYLRAACAQSQELNLYLGATTNRASQVGTFYCTNALWWNWRYAPLVDANNNRAVVKLGNPDPDQPITLRLEVAPSMPKYTSVQYQMALNYLAFVPAVPQVYSTSQFQKTNTQWTAETSLLVDTGKKQIIIPQPNGSTRFYRVAWSSQVKINKIAASGGNVVLTYQ
jgi:hypothetical protein